MAAKPSGSGEPKGWKPSNVGCAASIPAERMCGPANKLVKSRSLLASSTADTSYAPFSLPLHMSTEYQRQVTQTCATTDATVNSRPGMGTRQSRSTAGSRTRRTLPAAAKTSSPVTRFTIRAQRTRPTRHDGTSGEGKEGTGLGGSEGSDLSATLPACVAAYPSNGARHGLRRKGREQLWQWAPPAKFLEEGLRSSRPRPTARSWSWRP